MLEYFKNVLIIAPHPDDETLGVGGTIKKLKKLNTKISLLVVGGHLPPLYSLNEYKKTENECKKASKILGIKKIYFLKKIATKFNEEPISEFNESISKIINLINPDAIFIPFPDRHIDHRLVFDACMVCTRPKNKSKLKMVLAYETLSETHWNAPYIEPNFNPDFFINIETTIKDKIKALKCYQSQIKGNQSRSLKAVEALAKFRGSQNGCKYAEGFKLIRAIV